MYHRASSGIEPVEIAVILPKTFLVLAEYTEVARDVFAVRQNVFTQKGFLSFFDSGLQPVEGGVFYQV